MKSKLTKDRLWKIGSVLLALGVWQVAAMLLNEELLLASPVSVIARLFTVWQEPLFFASLWFSFSRIVLGFLCALLVGTAFAVAAARFRAVKTLLYPYMLVVKTVPVATLIVIAFVWFSSNTLSSFICFLIVLPTVYTNVLAALESVDSKMLEMARIFRLSPLSRFVAVYLPHIKPHFLSACALAAGLAFKSGIAAEIIAVPAGTSIGEMIYYAKLYLATTDLYVWTLLIVLLSVLFEKGFCALLSLGFRAASRLASPKVEGEVPTPRKATDAPEIILQNVNKSYESNAVLRDFSLQVPKAGVTAVMGTSGVGKTTLLRLLASLEAADSGTLALGEQVSFVFQEDRLSEDLSAVGNAMLGAPHVRAEDAAGLLLLMGLSGHTDRPVRELSGGMRRRVAIARALLSDAPLLLLDEPFKGLDDGTKEEIARVVKTYTEGKTVLLVTHDEREAALLGAHIITLENKKALA